MMEASICSAGLKALSNIGLNPIIDKTLNISLADPFGLNTDLCKFLNRSIYQGNYHTEYPTVIPTLYIDGKDMGTLENLKIQEIKGLAEPSSLGLGTKAECDENIRETSEIKGNRINLDFKLPEEVQAMAPIGYKITAKLYKLTICEKDGLFAEHSDTLHGDDHIGTLLVCLPVPNESGALIVSDDKNELRLPFDKMITAYDVMFNNNYNRVSWVAFYSDMKHQVEVVKSGIKMTLQFDLKVEPQNKDKHDPNTSLSSIIGREGVYQGKSYRYKLHESNQEILKNIKNKLKTILFVPKTESAKVNLEGDSGSITQKRDRSDNDEPFQLEQPQPTKQPRLDSDSDLEQNSDLYSQSESDPALGEHSLIGFSPDGIAILLRRKYSVMSLSTETLKGIDSTLFHALKDDFKVEVKFVVIEQRFFNGNGKFRSRPVEVIAISQFTDFNDSESKEEEKKSEHGPNNKYVPKTCDDYGQGKFEQLRRSLFIKSLGRKAKVITKNAKNVYLAVGSPPETLSTLLDQECKLDDEEELDEENEDFYQKGIYSCMQPALFIYPK